MVRTNLLINKPPPRPQAPKSLETQRSTTAPWADESMGESQSLNADQSNSPARPTDMLESCKMRTNAYSLETKQCKP